MLAVAGSFVCCSVIILFVCVVLLCVLFEPFKVVGVVSCGSAGNNKVVRWCGVSVVIHKVIGRLWMVLLVWMV